jgi:hypothetical protein
MAPTRSSGSSNELQTQVELSKRVEIVGAEEAAMLITDAATSDRQALSPTCDRMRTWKSTSSIRLSARGIGSAGVASILESGALYDKLLAFYRARGSRFAIREIVMIQLQSAQPIDSPSESRSLEMMLESCSGPAAVLTRRRFHRRDVCTGGMVAPFVASSAPTTVTVGPATTGRCSDPRR